MSEEKRTTARIETSISCDLATDSTSFSADVLNLSLTGAALLGPVGAAQRGDLVTLMIDHEPRHQTELRVAAEDRKQCGDGHPVRSATAG